MNLINERKKKFKEKKIKPISQLVPLYPAKQPQLKVPFNLVEHCPPFKH